MEIIHLALTGDYERYENLTLQKEQFEKEAQSYYLLYLAAFGDLLTKSFRLKVDCIERKKKIALYVAAKNRGNTLTPEEVNAYIEIHMAAYYEELKDLIKKNKLAKKTSEITFAESEEVKKIFRRLSKLLHPDISPLTNDYPELKELYNRVVLAYKCNDLKSLRSLEVLINKALQEKGIEGFSMEIPNISDRIKELEEEINNIVTTEPYSYKKILEDNAAVEAKKEALAAEITEYKNYKAKLNEKLKELTEET